MDCRASIDTCSNIVVWLFCFCIRADFVRPIFLHALGGVYLDNDVECFADMTPWLLGADLVLQEQVGNTVLLQQQRTVIAVLCQWHWVHGHSCV